MFKRIIAIVFVLGAALTPATAKAQEKSASSDQTFLDFQVQQTARVKTGSAPEYPERLRSARMEGTVLVQFVVDENGTPKMDTFKVLRSSDAAFSEAVRTAVNSSEFYPAENKGKKVKQLVQQMFRFSSK